MRIVLNGKKVGNGYLACYMKNKAYFTKSSLNRRIILHELYHHLIETKGLEMSDRKEEKKANIYAKEFLE